MSLKQKFSISILTKVFTVPATFITAVVISRTLGAEYYGQYKYLILLLMTSYLFSGLGIFEANSQFLALKKTDKDFSFIFALFFGFFIYIIIIVFFFTFMHISDSEIIKLYFFPVFIMLMFIHILFNNMGQILIGLDLINEYNIISSVKAVLTLIGVWILYVFNKFNLRGIIFTQILVTFVCLTIIIYFIRPNLRKIEIKSILKKSILTKYFKRGLLIYGSNVSTFLNYRLDMFLIKYFLGYSLLGIYSIAVMIVEKIWLIPESFRTILFLEVAKERKDKELVNQLTRVIFSVVFLLTIILSLTSPFFIPLVFSQKYGPSVQPLILLLPGVLFFTLSKMLSSYFFAKNLVKVNTIASVTAFVINLVLNIILIPVIQIKGVAIASTISYSFGGLYQLYMYKKDSQSKLKEILIVKPSDIKQIYSSIMK